MKPSRLAPAVAIMVLASTAHAAPADPKSLAGQAEAESAKAIQAQRKSERIREQIEKLAVKRKARAAAVARSKAAIKKNLAVVLSASARMSKSTKVTAGKDAVALEGALRAHAEASKLQMGMDESSKAQRSAEDELLKLLEAVSQTAALSASAAAASGALSRSAQAAATTAKKSAAQAKRTKAPNAAELQRDAVEAADQAAVAMRAAQQATKSAAVARQAAQRSMSLGALGNASAISARRAQEDKELAALSFGVAGMKDSLDKAAASAR